MAAALCVLVVGAALLAWWKLSQAGGPPVLTVTQALLLVCTDHDERGDVCTPYRVGGTLVAGSVRGDVRADNFEFTLTDGCFDWLVYYHGDAARLARLNAGDFVVAEGSTGVDGNFHSVEIFAGAEAARLDRVRQIPFDIPREACLRR